MRRPKIKITLVERLGSYGCHRGHKIGDTFDYDTERGKLCPMAMHVALPYIDILRYGVLTFTIHEKSELISNWERVRIFLFMSKTWRRFLYFSLRTIDL